MIVFAAGAFFNVIFAFVLASILWTIGRPVTADQASTRIGRVAATLETEDNVTVPSPAMVAGLKPGDRILAVDGSAISDFMEFQHAVISSTGVDEKGNRALDITIERDGKSQTLRVNPVRAGEERFRKVGVEPEYDVFIAGILPGSAADKLGLREGDRFVEINGRLVRSGGTLSEILQEPTPTAPVKVLVERAGKQVALEAAANQPLLTQLTGLSYQSQWSLVYHNPIEQFHTSIKTTVETLLSLLHPRGDIALSNMSGPIGIGRGFWAAAKSDYPIRFGLWFAVLVNINLAIFNLLPIPVLDGGHMLFATISRLRRRPLPINFVMTTQSVFMVLLFSMIIYVSFFDSRRWVRDTQQERAAERERAAEQEKATATPPPAVAPAK
jgi:regulator of sigma E protease